MKKMKTTKRVFIAAVLALFVVTACENTEEVGNNSIEGTYYGSLTTETKSAVTRASGLESATAEVVKAGNDLVQVHMYGNEMDTTFMLNYYEDHDSIMVCLTGEKFEDMYGHMLGDGHMGGGMMGDISNGETEWQHHIGDEHNNGDEHFGGFDMGNHSFGYSLRMEENGTPYYLHFKGTKNE
jgi:hypothetical protein